MVEIPLGMLFGFFLWFFLRYGFGGFYTVAPSERAVLKAGAMRPPIVGSAIAQIARRADVCNALFDVLEIQQLVWAEGLVVQVIPPGADLLAQISAATVPRPPRGERRVLRPKKRKKKRPRESAAVACPFCGEAEELFVDAGGGDAQVYTEDCAVCCRPRVVHVEPGDEPGGVRVWLERSE